MALIKVRSVLPPNPDLKPVASFDDYIDALNTLQITKPKDTRYGRVRGLSILDPQSGAPTADYTWDNENSMGTALHTMLMRALGGGL